MLDTQTKTNCTNCPHLRFGQDDEMDCGVYYCDASLRTIIDEYDFEIFKKNNHKNIPQPFWCFLIEK